MEQMAGQRNLPDQAPVETVRAFGKAAWAFGIAVARLAPAGSRGQRRACRTANSDLKPGSNLATIGNRAKARA